MRRIDEFPGDLSQPWDHVTDEMLNLTEVVTGPGAHWSLFQHTHHSDDTWFLWCNEGYGLQLYDYELDAMVSVVEAMNDG